MKKEINLKALGIAGMIIGTGATIFQSFVDDKKTDAKIEKKVSEAIAKLMK